MCVAALAWNAHPDWPLVAIGNRDEFHDRPAAPLARWQDAPGVLAGRDLKSGGTWLGLSEAGRFVLVTNRRGFGDPQPDRVSRGKLVTDMLAASGDYADPAADRFGDFNPFNLFAVAQADSTFSPTIPNRCEPAASPASTACPTARSTSRGPRRWH